MFRINVRFCALLLALIVILPGCANLDSIRYSVHPENPWADDGIEKVLVFPFVNRTQNIQLDHLAFSEIFASELTRFSGFTVVRPREAIAVAKAEEIGKLVNPKLDIWDFSLNDVLRISRVLQADAVVIASVDEYEQYPPPSIAMHLQMFTTRNMKHSAMEIDRMVQAGQPIAFERSQAGNVVFAQQQLIDAHRKETRREIRGYANNHVEDDTASDLDREFITVKSRFFQFVSNYLMRTAIEDWKHVQQVRRAEEPVGN